jgi:hypothetical protein
MKWFGRSWGAIALRFEEHVATPIGTPCLACKMPIQSADQGVVMPFAPVAAIKVDLSEGTGVSVSAGLEMHPMHLDCFLRSLHPCGGCHRCRPDKYPLN